ncbi:MAG: hypothetical protein ACYCTL_08500 [Acidimicrobiales bacterium]
MTRRRWRLAHRARARARRSRGGGGSYGRGRSYRSGSLYKPARSLRPGRLVAGMAAAVLVVVAGAGIVRQIGPQSGPFRRNVDRSFAVLAAPLARSSSASGRTLGSMMAGAAGMSRAELTGTLRLLVSQTSSVDQAMATLVPPAPAGGDAECEGAMAKRASAMVRIETAIEGLLGGPTGTSRSSQSSAVAGLLSAGSLLTGSDRMWAACRHQLWVGPGSARLPGSRWVTDPSLWTVGGLSALATQIASSPSLAPVDRLVLRATALTPPPVSIDPAGAAVMPPTGSVLVRVVVADTGNVQQESVTLTAGIATAASGAPAPSSMVRSFAGNVDPGGSVAVVFPALHLGKATAVTLVVRATSAGGTTVTEQLPLEVAPPTG